VASSLSMVVHVGDGGSFLYDGAPIVAATGADVTRSLTVVLGRDARALVRETSVRGRTAAADLPGILPGVRTADSTFAVGWDVPELEDVPADATLRLDEPGGIVRALAPLGERVPSSAGLAYTAWRASALAR